MSNEVRGQSAIIPPAPLNTYELTTEQARFVERVYIGRTWRELAAECADAWNIPDWWGDQLVGIELVEAAIRVLGGDWLDDPDEWYAREVERMAERAPA